MKSIIIVRDIYYRYAYDSQGNIVRSVDIFALKEYNYYQYNGETVAKYSYDAWGVCTVEYDTNGIANINPYRYRSYYYDSEIGMYYLQSRYYNPNVGRFVNGDLPEIIAEEFNSLIQNLYTYCNNNSIIYVDDFGSLSIVIKTHPNKEFKTTILTINQFARESNKVKNNLSAFHKFKSSNIGIINITTIKNFTSQWNKLGSKDIVVINSHANPFGIGESTHHIVEISDVESLEKKEIKCLILLGCNAGHTDYKKSNIAYAFLKKVSGCVLASDGTVYSEGILKFNSKGDKSWKTWLPKKNSRKKNNGWMLYEKDTCTKTGLYKISISSAVEFLKKKKKLPKEYNKKTIKIKIPKLIRR